MLLALGFPARGYRIESVAVVEPVLLVVSVMEGGVDVVDEGDADLDIYTCSTCDSDVSRYSILSVRCWVFVTGGDQ